MTPDVPHPLEIGAAASYAAPAGSAERGGALSDTTVAVAALDLDATYRFTRALGVTAWARIGAGVPTLCATADDCLASVGRDVAIAARARFYLPAWGRLEPRVDAGVGYEWALAKLSDRGAASRRTWAGPLAASLEAAAPFRLSERVSLGPALGAQIGAYASSALETPSFTADRAGSGRSLHAWLSVAVRAAVRF